MTKESAEHVTWRGMRERCTNINCTRYRDYGGRGITVCVRWQNSFEDFLEDMGRKPTPNHVIDRIDNDGNYEPSNCKWATQKESCNNRRTSKLYTFNGKTQTIPQWADNVGILTSTLNSRIGNYGWDLERALVEPIDNTRRRNPK